MAIAHNIELFPSRLHEDWRYFRLKREDIENRLHQAVRETAPAIDPVTGVRSLDDQSTAAVDTLFRHTAFDMERDIYTDLLQRYAPVETLSIDQDTDRFQPIHLDVTRESGFQCRNIRILVQPGVTAEVLLKVDGSAVNSFINGEVKVLVSEGASLKLGVLSVGVESSLSVLRLSGLISANANLHLFNLQTGSGQTRGEYRLTLAGSGGDLKVDQAVIVDGKAVNDAVVKMVHGAPETRSDMNTITYATDHGTGILNGLIHVKPGSSNVEAYQEAKNYILSDTAYSVGYPQLEIENQEVACSHGTTMHAFDKDQLFYLASRGIDEKTGKAMILKGNIDYFFRNMNEENKERFLHHAYGKIDTMTR